MRRLSLVRKEQKSQPADALVGEDGAVSNSEPNEKIQEAVISSY